MLPLPPPQPQETTIVPIGGGHPAHYLPVSLDDIEHNIIPTLTDGQRRILICTSKGMGRAMAAESAHISPDTIELWCKTIPAFRNAYYSTMAAGKTFSAEAIKASAIADGLLHYTSISELAQGPATNAKEKAVKLAAAKEALTIAGAYKVDTLAPGDTMEMVAIRIRKARQGTMPPDAGTPPREAPEGSPGEEESPGSEGSSMPRP